MTHCICTEKIELLQRIHRYVFDASKSVNDDSNWGCVHHNQEENGEVKRNETLINDSDADAEMS